MSETIQLRFEENVEEIGADEPPLINLVEEGAEENDVTIEDSVSPNSFDPITWALIIGTALAAAKLVAWIIDKFRGRGMIITLGTKPPVVKRSKEVLDGVVVIVAADGKSVDLETVEIGKDELERMFETLFKLPIDATVSTIKSIIEKAKSAGQEEPKK